MLTYKLHYQNLPHQFAATMHSILKLSYAHAGLCLLVKDRVRPMQGQGLPDSQVKDNERPKMPELQIPHLPSPSKILPRSNPIKSQETHHRHLPSIPCTLHIQGSVPSSIGSDATDYMRPKLEKRSPRREKK